MDRPIRSRSHTSICDLNRRDSVSTGTQTDRNYIGYTGNSTRSGTPAFGYISNCDNYSNYTESGYGDVSAKSSNLNVNFQQSQKEYLHRESGEHPITLAYLLNDLPTNHLDPDPDDDETSLGEELEDGNVFREAFLPINTRDQATATDNDPPSVQETKKRGCSKYSCKVQKTALLVVSLAFIVSVIVLYVKGTPETPTQKTVPCEGEWIMNRGKCYYFADERYTWNNSREFCISHNSSLALIDSEVELKFLTRFKGLDNHWIGLSWNDSNNSWTWVNGTLYGDHIFKIESSGNQDKNECVYLNHDGVKGDAGDHERKWICSRIN